MVRAAPALVDGWVFLASAILSSHNNKWEDVGMRKEAKLALAQALARQPDDARATSLMMNKYLRPEVRGQEYLYTFTAAPTLELLESSSAGLSAKVQASSTLHNFPPIQAGDVILAINGQDVSSYTAKQVTRLVAQQTSGCDVLFSSKASLLRKLEAISSAQGRVLVMAVATDEDHYLELLQNTAKKFDFEVYVAGLGEFFPGCK